jgi:MYXO-CTERM domain-containing protein
VGAFLVVSEAHAATVPGELIAEAGEVPMGSDLAITSLRAPFVSASGHVAFMGVMGSTARFVFIDDTVVWLTTDETPTIAGLEPHITTLEGDYVVSGNSDGVGVLWADGAALVMDGDPAPGFPLFPAAAFTNLQRPTMSSNGDVVWRGAVDFANDGGSDVIGLFRRPVFDDAPVEALYVSGQTIDGVTLAGNTGAIGVDFAVSDNGAHIIAAMTAAGDSATDRLLVLDDAVVAREGDTVPSFPGETWDAFGLSSVNDDGHYLFSGETDAPSSTDSVIGYDGDVVFHEGDVIDGLTMYATPRFVALNDNNNAAFGWAINPASVEHVFVACNADNLATDARLLLSTDDALDLDGDDMGDVIVGDIVMPTNDPGRFLGDADAVFLEVRLEPDNREAIVRVPFSCCGNGNVDGGEACDDGNDDDTDDCLSTCVAATCGDGFVQAGVEACDDGNLDDGDDCDSTCGVERETSSTGETGTTGSTGAASTSTGPDASTSTTAASTDTTGSESGDVSTGGGDSTSSSGGGPTESTTTDATESTSGSETGETDTDGTTSSDGGCGCTTEQPRRPAIGWALLLGLGALSRRRRR